MILVTRNHFSHIVALVIMRYLATLEFRRTLYFKKYFNILTYFTGKIGPVSVGVCLVFCRMSDFPSKKNTVANVHVAR